MLRKTFALVACGMMISATAYAGPLDRSDVAKDARWVVHVDFEALADSKIAEKAGEKWPEKTQKLRSHLESEMGITPQEDLKSLTMFSTSYDRHSGVAILHAKFDRQKVKSSLESKADVKTTKWEDHTLYTYDVSKHKATDHHAASHAADDKAEDHSRADHSPKDHGEQTHHSGSYKSKDHPKTVTTAIVDRNTLVCAASPEAVKQAIKLLENESESLAKASDSKLVKADDAGALVYASAIKLGEFSASEGPLSVLRQHEHACYTLKEHDGKLKEQLVLVASDEEVAEKMEDAAEGLIALLDVWTTDSKELNQMIAKTEIEQEGTTLRITWQGTPGDAITAFEQVARHAKEAKENRQK